jgi:hypothetical protein
MDSFFERLFDRPEALYPRLRANLLRAARPDPLRIANALARVASDLEMLAESTDSSAELAGLCRDYSISISSAPPGHRERLEKQVFLDARVRCALNQVDPFGWEEYVRDLLTYDRDTTARYDGDSAISLLESMAETLPMEEAKAMRWLARQPMARHAFAVNSEDDPVPAGLEPSASDLSREKQSTTLMRRSYYDEYLKDRWQAYRDLKGCSYDYSLDEEDEKIAHKAYVKQECLRTGLAPRTIEQRIRRDKIACTTTL